MCLFISLKTVSQSSLDSATNNTLHLFAASLGNQSPLYNGIQYVRYPSFIHTGNPFFIADSLINGSVIYEGLIYDKVPLLLDEVNDQLITTDVQGDNLVQIFKSGVEVFNIGKDSFVKTTISGSASSYYRVLYSGNSQILTKENKLIQVRAGRTNEETERWVSATSQYYVKTRKGYQQFNRLNSFLAIFGKDRNAVARYLKENKLRRAAREDLYIRAAMFYDQLTD